MSSGPALIENGSFAYGEHRLHYETYGPEDGTPCILLHGILLDTLVNRDLARRFAREGFRVILLDLLGHGQSDKTSDPKDHRTDFYALQVLALMDHLKLERAMVGGVSLGCIVALQVAVRAPDRVTGLFLEMPVLEWSAPWAAVLLFPLLLSSRLLRFAQRPMARVLRKLPRPRQETVASVMNTMSLEPSVMAAILHGVLVGPIAPTEEQRKHLKMPALVVGHSGDKLHAREDADVLARQLPRGRLIEARHMLELRTRPDRLWPQIAEFLGEVRAELAPAQAPKIQSPGADGQDLSQRFEEAVAKVKNAPANGPLKPSNEMKLKMYALYSQATKGDATGARPGAFDMVGRFKYDAWAALKGVSKEEAMRRYVAEIEQLERKSA